MGGLQGSIKRILFLKGRQIQRDLRARTRSQLSPSGQSAHRPIQINLCLRQVAEKPASRTNAQDLFEGSPTKQGTIKDAIANIARSRPCTLKRHRLPLRSQKLLMASTVMTVPVFSCASEGTSSDRFQHRGKQRRVSSPPPRRLESVGATC